MKIYQYHVIDKKITIPAQNKREACEKIAEILTSESMSAGDDEGVIWEDIYNEVKELKLLK